MKATPQSGSVITFHGVSFHLPDGRVILEGLDLEVQQGETVVLLGRSGSGKTTALKLINGLLEPTAGEVLVEGRSSEEWNPIRLRRRIGYVIQEVGLFPHYTVERNIGLLPRLEGWPEERVRNRVMDLLRMVGLEASQFARRYPHELSGGQRQRVGVARALAADPPILLMDEPFGALDPLTRTEIQNEVLELVRRLQKTVVVVTHDVHEALRLGTRIALLDAGKLLGVHHREDFLRATTPLARAFLATLGTSRAAQKEGGEEGT